ncbi:MAG: hypothetical protein AAFQ82_04590, partial [Myxococcota bacterium]
PLQCDDGLFCNGVESCEATSGCVGGTAPAVDDGDVCTTDSCDETNDIIVNAPITDCGNDNNNNSNENENNSNGNDSDNNNVNDNENSASNDNQNSDSSANENRNESSAGGVSSDGGCGGCQNSGSGWSFLAIFLMLVRVYSRRRAGLAAG